MWFFELFSGLIKCNHSTYINVEFVLLLQYTIWLLSLAFTVIGQWFSIVVSCLHLCSCLMFIIFNFKFKFSFPSYRCTWYACVPGCLGVCSCSLWEWAVVRDLCVCFSSAKCYRVCSAVMMMFTYRSVLSLCWGDSFLVAVRMLLARYRVLCSCSRVCKSSKNMTCLFCGVFCLIGSWANVFASLTSRKFI